MNITGAIFDFDGTLFDSMHVWKGIRYKVFDILGLNPTDEERKSFEGLYLSECISLAKEKFSLKETQGELLEKIFEYIRSRYMVEAEPKNDVIEFLEKLKARGVKMGIATATGESALMPLLEKFGMENYFSVIYSTYTVGASKRESKVYDMVLSELGTEKETTWVFEDALYAATTAKANGYKVIGIYDVSESQQAELEALVDLYIHSFGELNIE